MADVPTGGRFDAIVARLHGLHPRLIDLSLDRLRRLLDDLGNPERRLPPVVHVAGTNGKGSTCAFVRAMAEAAGQSVHVFTSPHLVSFNERIRLAGRLVDDATLADAIEEVEAANAGDSITVFEVVTAAALLLFARVPADLAVLEVGLGGRADATNVVPAPAACLLTSISIDHREFLGDTLDLIATEKAGIIKPGAVVVSGRQAPEAAAVLQAHADAAGTGLALRDRDWTIEPAGTGLVLSDEAGRTHLPMPSLPGVHQYDNVGIALLGARAALRLPAERLVAGAAQTQWPARLQRLHGALAAMLPAGWELWLDGGHNEGAGVALRQHLASWADRPVDLVIGMKQTKDARSFLAPLLPAARSVWAVAELGQHLALPVADIVAASAGRARPGPTVAEALRRMAGSGEAPARVLICGSLYLAGCALRADGGLS